MRLVQGIMDNFYFDPRGKIAIFPKDSVVDNFYSAPLATSGSGPRKPHSGKHPYFAISPQDASVGYALGTAPTQ